ncbi:MAG: hypothetical protein JSU94_12295 [Phycisphaerales bacterium]|nr:MAG: hypothetical protein JSU94_12295 [Phycisphaerales bacterium]
MNRRLLTIWIVAGAGLAPILLGGCQSDAQTGALIGTLVGAGIGQMAGGHAESTLVGAAVGGGIGYIIGNESDKQRTEAERHYVREQMNYVTVNMTNSNGSISRVRLRKHGVGYVGTRGEFYDRLPTEDQLRPIYGF